MCCGVSAVPQEATAFFTPFTWAEITSKYPSIMITPSSSFMASFALFSPNRTELLLYIEESGEFKYFGF